MSEKKHLHTELGISSERMDQMRNEVIEHIRKIKDEEEEQDDTTLYSQIIMACSRVPNDMEEAILLGMIISRALISFQLSRVPIIGDLAISIINQKM
jgi:hypothetical protein